MDQKTDATNERTALDEFLGRESSTERARQLRRIAPIAGVVLLALLAYAFFGSHKSRQPSYATAPVQRGDLKVTV